MDYGLFNSFTIILSFLVYEKTFKFDVFLFAMYLKTIIKVIKAFSIILKIEAEECCLIFIIHIHQSDYLGYEKIAQNKWF
jgi:hypothetical protein